MENHVAVFTPDLNAGGAQRVTINVINGLIERGMNVDLVMPYRKGDLFQDVHDDARIYFLKNSEQKIAGSLSCLLAYRDYLDNREPKIIISQRTHGNLITILASSLSKSRPPTIITEHTKFGRISSTKDLLTVIGARYLYRNATICLSVSEGVAESVKGYTKVRKEQSIVIYNPIDIEVAVTRAAEPVNHRWFDDKSIKVILSAGRLHPVKNYTLLISAFKKVYAENPSTRLVILGEGSERERLEDQIETNNLSHVVELPGYVDNPYKYMSKSSIFVLTSQYEGFGNVLVEAMATGCPVLSTNNLTGPSEIISDERFGELVNDNIDDITEGILSILSKSYDSKDLVERSKDFSQNIIMDEYHSLVKNMIEYQSTTDIITDYTMVDKD